jgi:hypothetical protein
VERDNQQGGVLLRPERVNDFGTPFVVRLGSTGLISAGAVSFGGLIQAAVGSTGDIGATPPRQ